MNEQVKENLNYYKECIENALRVEDSIKKLIEQYKDKRNDELLRSYSEQLKVHNIRLVDEYKKDSEKTLYITEKVAGCFLNTIKSNCSEKEFDDFIKTLTPSCSLKKANEWIQLIYTA